MHEHVTLLRPDARDQAPRGISSGFPVDLLSQSAGRLRVLALLYAFVFFMAGIFPALLFSEDRARFLGSFLQWGPSVVGIGVALLVAAVIPSPRLPLPAAMTIGLAFEIVSSWVPVWFTTWARRSSARASWGATAWRRSLERAGWERS